MSRLKYIIVTFLFFVIWVNSIVAIPTPLGNHTSNEIKDTKPRPKFVELQLPVKIASMDDVFAWVRNAMRSMASKIDITLTGNKSPGNETLKSVNKVDSLQKRLISTKVETKEQSASSRSGIAGHEGEAVNAWSKTGNEIFAPLLNAEAFVPLFFGNKYVDKLKADSYSKYTYNSAAPEDKKVVNFNSRSASPSAAATGQNTSSIIEVSTESLPQNRIINNSGTISPTHVPFSIPFEAFITITREHESGSSKLQESTTSSSNNPQNISSPTTITQSGIRAECNHSRPHFTNYYPNIADDLQNYRPPNFEQRPYTFNNFDHYDDYNSLNDEKKRQSAVNNNRERPELPVRNNKNSKSKNKEKSRKRPLGTLGDILKSLNFTKKPKKNSKLQGAASTTSGIRKPSQRPLEDSPRRPTFQFEDELPQRATRNETFEKQEFDDDDDSDEAGGSLGSVADLLPLALPILEGLSDPDSEDDLIEVIQAAVPILQGLSEGDDDEDGAGGINDLIATIVPVIIRIINGRDGQGIDLAGLFGPIFSLLAPFIGPILAPIIGPLIRTISNPPTEGSSLGALITAIAGPLSTPQEPSGMSPLSIVIAGATTALLRELKPGAPGGSDVGALVGSILSGVIAGTSAGLSGGSSGSKSEMHPGYSTGPVSSSSVNVDFPGGLSPSPHNNPFSNRPSHSEATVHIGSTVRPSYSSVRPTFSYPPHQATVATPQKLPSPRPQVQYHSGPVTAATGSNGGSSYLPMGTAVPASSVNPLALLGNSVKDILGAGIQVVSSVINAVFGIIGASSAEQPKPTYGPPSGYGAASG